MLEISLGPVLFYSSKTQSSQSLQAPMKGTSRMKLFHIHCPEVQVTKVYSISVNQNQLPLYLSNNNKLEICSCDKH